jgi:hypothetical protein
VDRAGQLRVRLGGLGGDHDVGAVSCAAQRDRLPDAPARAGDEDGSVLQVGHGLQNHVWPPRRQDAKNGSDKGDGWTRRFNIGL